MADQTWPDRPRRVSTRAKLQREFLDLIADAVRDAAEIVGDASRFMLENQEVQVSTHEGVPLFIELPPSVELRITHTDPGLQGDRSTGGTKPATLETGAEIQVPLFINTGDKLKIDSRDGNYLGRVNS